MHSNKSKLAKNHEAYSNDSKQLGTIVTLISAKLTHPVSISSNSCVNYEHANVQFDFRPALFSQSSEQSAPVVRQETLLQVHLNVKFILWFKIGHLAMRIRTFIHTLWLISLVLKFSNSQFNKKKISVQKKKFQLSTSLWLIILDLVNLICMQFQIKNVFYFFD